jgi:hypothetical protein
VPKYLLDKIKEFYKDLNDKLSGGPSELGGEFKSIEKEGCWDLPLRLELDDNPLHILLEMLKKSFGEFIIHDSSIRYLAYPFTPHTDIRSSEWLLENRKKYNTGHTMIIPFAWEEGYNPGTAFFSSPPKDGEPLYVEKQDVLPKLQNPGYAKHFSVKKIFHWKNPGDLLIWENYKFHCSTHDPAWQYTDDKHCKEFISIETFRPKYIS